MASNSTILQLIHADETGDSYYRMRWPAEHLAKVMPDWRVINLDARARDRYLWAEKADLLVLYQSQDLDMLTVMDKRRASGKRTLVEYNDNFYSAPLWSPVASAWRSPVLWQTYETIMRASDGIIVTGPGLQNLFAPVVQGKPIYQIPNYFSSELKNFELLHDPRSAALRVGWGGSLGHMADFLSILPIVRELMNEIPNLHFYAMGNKAIPDLASCPSDRFHFTHWGSVHDYYQFIEKLHIGLIPLQDTPYNRCRSDIKAVEISAFGVLPIVPNSLPYEEFIRATGLKPYGTQAEIKELIHSYANRRDELRVEAGKCYEYVKEHRLQNKDNERVKLYKEMLSPKTEDFDWGLANGYHLITGVSENEMPSMLILRQIEGLIKDRKIEEASKLLQSAPGNHKDWADFALLRLKILGDLKVEQYASEFTRLKAYFPNDFRFYLVGLQCAKGVNERSQIWSDIVNLFSSQCESYRDFYRRTVVKLFLVYSNENPIGLIQLGEQLLSIFKGACELHMLLAHLYERKGDVVKAREHFSNIKQALIDFHANKEALANYDLAYITAWSDALSMAN